jgi:hypothetical protein
MDTPSEAPCRPACGLALEVATTTMTKAASPTGRMRCKRASRLARVFLRAAKVGVASDDWPGSVTLPGYVSAFRFVVGTRVDGRPAASPPQGGLLPPPGGRRGTRQDPSRRRRRDGGRPANLEGNEGGNMLLGTFHPAVRLVVGAVLLAIGVAMHKVLLDVAGGAVILLSAVQWLSRARR